MATNDVGLEWEGQGWNDGGSDLLLIGIERDQDTDGWDEWCWRIALRGKVVAHGREQTHKGALEAATFRAMQTEWYTEEKSESP